MPHSHEVSRLIWEDMFMASVRILQELTCSVSCDSLEETWLDAYCQSIVWAGAAPLGHVSFLLCAAWGKHKVLLEQLRVSVVLCKITLGSRQGGGLNELIVHALRDRAGLRALLLASVPFPVCGLATVMCHCAGMLSW